MILDGLDAILYSDGTRIQKGEGKLIIEDNELESLTSSIEERLNGKHGFCEYVGQLIADELREKIKNVDYETRDNLQHKHKKRSYNWLLALTAGFGNFTSTYLGLESLLLYSKGATFAGGIDPARVAFPGALLGMEAFPGVLVYPFIELFSSGRPKPKKEGKDVIVFPNHLGLTAYFPLNANYSKHGQKIITPQDLSDNKLREVLTEGLYAPLNQYSIDTNTELTQEGSDILASNLANYFAEHLPRSRKYPRGLRIARTLFEKDVRVNQEWWGDYFIRERVPSIFKDAAKIFCTNLNQSSVKRSGTNSAIVTNFHKWSRRFKKLLGHKKYYVIEGDLDALGHRMKDDLYAQAQKLVDVKPISDVYGTRKRWYTLYSGALSAASSMMSWAPLTVGYENYFTGTNPNPNKLAYAPNINNFQTIINGVIKGVNYLSTAFGGHTLFDPVVFDPYLSVMMQCVSGVASSTGASITAVIGSYILGRRLRDDKYRGLYLMRGVK